MANEKEIIKKDTSLGAVRIADEVVSIIAGLAATEVEGIAGMSGGIAGGIAEMLGRKNFAKGVKVEVGEKEAADGTVAVRPQGGGQQSVMTIQEFIGEVNGKVAEMTKDF